MVLVPVLCRRGPWSDCWMYPSAGTSTHCMPIRTCAYCCSLPLPHTIHLRAGVQCGCLISCTSCLEVCTEGVNLARKTQGRAGCSTPFPPPPPTSSCFWGWRPAGGSVGGRFPLTPPCLAPVPLAVHGPGQQLNARQPCRDGSTSTTRFYTSAAG